LYVFLISPVCSVCPPISSPLVWAHNSIQAWWVQMMSLLIMKFSPSRVTLSEVQIFWVHT
jgi:hypothetical protein